MLTGFICPDGEKITIAECLIRCRLGERCLTLPTLKSASYQRGWKGKPSTTQCLNGTRFEFLKITQPYYIDPEDTAYALLGTRHHGRLEAIAKKMNVLSEEQLDDEVKGTLDLLEPDDQSAIEAYILTDYKSSGSFAVARALGIVKVGKEPDPCGATYKTSGKWGKAGTPKMVDTFVWDETKADIFNWEMQDNNYRVMVEPLGFPVSKMFIQCTVRDGGTATARGNGVFKRIYKIPIRRIPDDEVRSFFSMKSKALIDALVSNTKPPMCSNRETWYGRRCEKFCEVKEFC